MILKGKYSGYHTLLNFRQLLVMGHLVHKVITWCPFMHKN